MAPAGHAVHESRRQPLHLPGAPQPKKRSEHARHLRITHRWVERSTTRPPRPSDAPVYPSDGGLSDGTDVVFQWNAATDPDGDAVTDYHFQLSDRPDIRWPLSPNFEKYISKTPDKGSNRYTLPRPGLLTPGKTYYWHVKAKDSTGARGLDRHLEFHSGGAGISHRRGDEIRRGRRNRHLD